MASSLRSELSMLHFDPLVDPLYKEVQARSDLIEQSYFGYRYQLIWEKSPFPFH